MRWLVFAVAAISLSGCGLPPNIREVVAFPMNQRAEDLMMHAPAEVPPERLGELHLKLELPPD